MVRKVWSGSRGERARGAVRGRGTCPRAAGTHRVDSRTREESGSRHDRGVAWQWTSPNHYHNRGVTYWEGNGERRVYIATGDAMLIALDANSGQLIPGFGTDGRIDLTEGLRRPIDRVDYGMSTSRGHRDNVCFCCGRSYRNGLAGRSRRWQEAARQADDQRRAHGRRLGKELFEEPVQRDMPGRPLQ